MNTWATGANLRLETRRWLEQELNHERDENQRLHEIIAEKDERIAQLQQLLRIGDDE